MKNQNIKKTALVLGAGGFIGSHLVKRLKSEGYWVRGVDLKHPEYWETAADDFIIGDLRDPRVVKNAFLIESNDGVHPLKYEYNSPRPFVKQMHFDEVYQLAADMGGAGYIFTGENDANVMHNSALINLNVAKEAVEQKAKRVFYSSSACMYPEHNQLDPDNPNCEESSAYPANPDSEYGWEKLFSERLFLAFNRNYNLDVRVARFHNIFGPYGTWDGGKEKAPAAMCRKAAEVLMDGEIEVWGDGLQTRSFLYIDDCVNAILTFMRQGSFLGPVNIGSEEMVTINQLAEMAIKAADKRAYVKNIDGEEFIEKYGFKCPMGVRGRNSDNTLYLEKMGIIFDRPLQEGINETFEWINKQLYK
jgi:nucleoside-diphosphate-sugar epimerase